VSRKLLLNSVSGTVLYLVNVAVAFLLSPVLIRALGNRDYGLWEMVTSVIGYMGLLDLGIGPALVRFVSLADAKNDRDDLQQTVSTAFAFFLVIGGVALASLAGLGGAPQLVAGRETGAIAHLGAVFLLLGVNAGLLFPLQVFIATLMGLQRHYLINTTRGSFAVLRAVLAYYLLLRYPGRGLLLLALLEPLFTLGQVVIFVWAVRRDPAIPPLSRHAVTRAKFRELFGFGAKSATMMVAARLQNQSVPLIIGNLLGLGQVVYFAMPNRLVEYAKGISQTIGFPLTPYFGASLGRGDRHELLENWFRTTLALQVVSLAMPLVILFCGEGFLALWLGSEYAVAGRYIMYSLLVGLVADSLATNAVRILTVQGMHGRCAFIWLVLAASSIPLGMLGGVTWGVTGVALGTTVATVFGNLATVLLACRAAGITLARYFRETLLKLLVPLSVLAAALAGLTRIWPPAGYLGLALEIALALALYLAVIWRSLIAADLRRQLWDRLRLKLGMLRQPEEG